MTRSFSLRAAARATGLLLASVTLLAAPVSAQQAIPNSPANMVSDPRSPGGHRPLAAATDMLRVAFVLDTVAAWQGLAPDDRAQLRLAIGPEQERTAAALGWFMYGAAVRIARDDLAGLYNPIADVWLVLHWRVSAGAPRLAAAFLVPGAALRPDAEARRWSESGEPYAAALVTADARAAARFTELGEAGPAYALIEWLAPQRMTLRQQAFAQLTPWLDGLQEWRRDADWRRLRARLVAANGFAAGLSSLPPAVRRSLIPLGAMRRGGVPSLLLGSPLAPGRIVVIDNSAAGRPAIELVDCSDGGRAAAAAGGG